MPPQPPEDDDELELEPVDPEILAHRQERAQHAVDSAVKKIDVDELYEPHSNYSDLELDLSGLKSFRFTTRTLLLITAILAISMTVYLTWGGCMMIFAGMLTAIAAGFFWTSKQDRQNELERIRRREEFLANKDKQAAGAPAAASASKPASPFDPETPTPAAIEPEPAEKRPFFDVKFAFSMKELFITMTAVAVSLALLRWITPEYIAMLLGFVALSGLIANASGYEPPRLVVLGWWLLMVFYLAIGLFAAANPATP